MRRIKILDKKTAQLIAAGEISESPASVVKELIENSIDAGAKRITLEINGGGVKLIKVTDNGHGIYREDVKNAFARYGTSKIVSSTDISSISSLGFRGEALASICAVSKVELLTRSREETLGTHICVTAGEYGDIHDAGCPYGTVVSVRDLFYNIPARMKFLKSEVAEGNKISILINKLSLSHPEVVFKFVRDNKQTLCTPGDGKIDSTIYSVYGKKFFDSIIPVDYEFREIIVKGYISGKENFKSNKNIQNFFVNGRLIKCKLAITALEEAFKDYIISNIKPCFVLYLKIPYELVDVNVHPSKIEIKFLSEEDVFQAIYLGVKLAFNKYNLDSSPLKNNSKEFLPENFNLNKIYDFKEITDIKNSENGNLKNLVCAEPKRSLVSSLLISSPEHNEHENSRKFTLKELKIIGEIFSSYFILQYKENIILIDKNAACERIIFENLKVRSYKNDSKMLLNPVYISLSKIEYSSVIKNLDIFFKAGYKIDNISLGKIKVKSMPKYEEIKNLENSIIEIANYMMENEKSTETKKLDWIYHNVAVRCSVKASSKISKEEIIKFMKNLLENPSINPCFQGRPIYLEFNRKFIEKQFKRI